MINMGHLTELVQVFDLKVLIVPYLDIIYQLLLLVQTHQKNYHS